MHVYLYSERLLFSYILRIHDFVVFLCMKLNFFLAEVQLMLSSRSII